MIMKLYQLIISYDSFKTHMVKHLFLATCLQCSDISRLSHISVNYSTLINCKYEKYGILMPCRCAHFIYLYLYLNINFGLLPFKDKLREMRLL